MVVTSRQYHMYILRICVYSYYCPLSICLDFCIFKSVFLLADSVYSSVFFSFFPYMSLFLCLSFIICFSLCLSPSVSFSRSPPLPSPSLSSCLSLCLFFFVSNFLSLSNPLCLYLFVIVPAVSSTLLSCIPTSLVSTSSHLSPCLDLYRCVIPSFPPFISPSIFPLFLSLCLPFYLLPALSLLLCPSLSSPRFVSLSVSSLLSQSLSLHRSVSYAFPICNISLQSDFSPLEFSLSVPPPMFLPYIFCIHSPSISHPPLYHFSILCHSFYLYPSTELYMI